MAATATCVPSDVVGVRQRQRPWSATSAVFRDDAGRHEFQLVIDEGGRLSITLFGHDLDAFGDGTTIVIPVSPASATCAATVMLTGYDLEGNRFRRLEVTLSATWSVDRVDRTKIDVAGTALVIDLDDDGMVRYQAVRRHPFNHLDIGVLPTAPGPPALHGPSEACRAKAAGPAA